MVDLKESHSRSVWLRLLSWRALHYGAQRSVVQDGENFADGRVEAEREFVRERVIAHTRYVRPNLALMRELQEAPQLWTALPEMIIHLFDAGRSSFTHKDWDQLYGKLPFGQPVDAPFLTRIPWGCPSQFQLAPNVRSLAAAGSPPTLSARESPGMDEDQPTAQSEERFDDSAAAVEEEAEAMASLEPSASASAAMAPTPLASGSRRAPSQRAAAEFAAVELMAAVPARQYRVLQGQDKQTVYAVLVALQATRPEDVCNAITIDVLRHALCPASVRAMYDVNLKKDVKTFTSVLKKLAEKQGK